MEFDVPGLRSVREKNEIIVELENSRSENNVLGFFLRGEDELITTAVEEINGFGNDIHVQLKSLDLHGYPIGRNPVPLSEIRSVVHFNTKYDDPVYMKIRQRRNGIDENKAA
ncbi:MAG TPA: hypothetical protein VD927_14085 [Chryseosolibacter sp.]|nr:hypothetical protein [Chryseosolibacter sp.]